MFDLRINGHSAIVKAGTSIKLTRENPLLEDAGDWTLDVVLPLKGCPENLAIFGNALNRPEPSLAEWIDEEMPFTLLAPPLYLEGKAIVTNITQEEAKIQLLAGNSNLNASLYERAELVKLQDMNLGRVLENITYSGSTTAFSIPATEQRLREVIAAYWAAEEALARANGVDEGTTDKPFGLIFADPETYDATFAPIWSKTDGCIINEKVLWERYNDERSQVLFQKWVAARVVQSITGGEPSDYFKDRSHSPFAPMPYLSQVLERVLAALGFEVVENAVRGTWMERIAIANIISTTKLSRMLPDWTAKEFLQECRYFFGVEFLVNGKEVRIVRPAEYYVTIGTTDIAEATEETTADLNKDEEVKGFLREANVQYADLPDMAPMLSLPRDVIEQAEIAYVTSSGQIPEVSDKAKATIYCQRDDANPKAWAYLKGNGNIYKVAEVDLFRPHIGHGDVFSVEGRNIDIELRIRPSLMEYRGITHLFDVKNPNLGNVANGFTLYDDEKLAMKVPMLTTENSTGNKYAWTLDKAINADNPNKQETEARQTVDNRPDCIEVFYVDKDQTDGLYGTAFFGRMHEWTGFTKLHLGEGIPIIPDRQDAFYTYSYFGSADRFRMAPLSALDSVGNVIFKDMSVDTRLVRQFQFIDNLPAYDPTAVYVIRGRRYVCKKLELVIDEQGLQPMKTGYFYEQND